jgi:hypothetical protein
VGSACFGELARRSRGKKSEVLGRIVEFLHRKVKRKKKPNRHEHLGK